MPRKPTKDEPRRNVAVLVQLTEEEREMFRNSAKRAGLGVSPWLRMLGLRDAADTLRKAAP